MRFYMAIKGSSLTLIDVISYYLYGTKVFSCTSL